MAPFLALPLEILAAVLRACSTLSDILAFARTCKQVYLVFVSNAPSLYDSALRGTLPAFEDALRVQRVSVSAMRHTEDLGYNDGGYFQSMLPPRGVCIGPSPRLPRFDLDRDEFVNIPSEEDIIKLGQLPLASTWEAQRLLQLHQIMSTCHQSLSLPNKDRRWFSSEEKHVWTSDQTERFFRGAYRFWLYCAFFYPGCYLEPFYLEKDNVPKELYEEDPFELPQYPILIPDLKSRKRKRHVEALFSGFADWLAHDGEQRGLRECLPVIPNCGVYGESSPAIRGGMRELMLLHSMFFLLWEVIGQCKEQEELDEMAAYGARILLFGIGIAWGEIAICQIETLKNGHRGIQRYDLDWESQARSPFYNFSAFPEFAQYLKPAGWPTLEGIVIGLAKHYNVALSADLEIEDHDDYVRDGGAVVDIFDRVIPIHMVGEYF